MGRHAASPCLPSGIGVFSGPRRQDSAPDRYDEQDEIDNKTSLSYVPVEVRVVRSEVRERERDVCYVET